VEQQGAIGSICRLILHQFRWRHARAPHLDLVPKIINSHSGVPFAHSSATRSLILPDIAYDSDHPTIVVALHTIMTTIRPAPFPFLMRFQF